MYLVQNHREHATVRCHLSKVLPALQHRLHRLPYFALRKGRRDSACRTSTTFSRLASRVKPPAPWVACNAVSHRRAERGRLVHRSESSSVPRPAASTSPIRSTRPVYRLVSPTTVRWMAGASSPPFRRYTR